jgi:hypothetical protein
MTDVDERVGPTFEAAEEEHRARSEHQGKEAAHLAFGEDVHHYRHRQVGAGCAARDRRIVVGTVHPHGHDVHEQDAEQREPAPRVAENVRVIMRTHTRPIAAMLLMFSALATASAGVLQETTLRYRWTKGETVRYRFTQNTVNVISGLPAGMPEMKVDLASTQVLRAQIEETGQEGPTTIRQVLESVQLDMNTPAGKMSFDSARPASDGPPESAILAKVLSATVEEPYTIVLSPWGTVEKLEGIDRLTEKISKNLPSGPASEMVAGMLNSMLSDEGFREIVGQTFPELPERGVKPGETWSTQRTMKNPMLGDLATASTATLKAIEGSGADQVVRIATATTIRQESGSPATTPFGIKMSLGESTGEGEIVFDAARQRMRRSTNRTTLPMAMDGSAPDGTALNMKMAVTSTVTIELIQQ